MAVRSDALYFEQILEHLHQARGFDFTAYKRSSLMRRVVKRMQHVGSADFELYLDYLQVHQDEFAALFNTILINVTSFFRDPDVWTYASAVLLPALVEGRSNGAPVRIWSAGCASGQEPYTVAMLLAELVGAEALRDRVKIYATDVDEEALAEARLATYHERQLADVPVPMLEKYFERSGTHYQLNRDLRRAVIFGRHDLIQDAPISKVDLLLCRNTLMYFNADAQTRVLSRFGFSLTAGGALMLGRAEMLFSHASMFVPLDLKRRIFRTVPRPSQRDRLSTFTQSGRHAMANDFSNNFHVREAAFDSDAVPQLVLDPSNRVVAANAPARAKFGVTTNDIGRQLQDLDISYRPAELRAAVDRIHSDRKEVVLKTVRWAANGEVTYFDVTLSPLVDGSSGLLGTRITFRDVTQYQALQDELQHSKQELETAYEELQSTNEELETTNEELQSTVEELETTNEELQSTNEELETMNEELQSTNEELQTMNEELRHRSTDLNTANAFLESVFTSLQSAVAVVDREYRVQVWNQRAEHLWGVRSDEAVQAHFLGIDFGLPVGDLRPMIRDVLTGAQERADVTLPAVNRRGKAIHCQVSVTPLVGLDKSINGAILLMEEMQERS